MSKKFQKINVWEYESTNDLEGVKIVFNKPNKKISILTKMKSKEVENLLTKSKKD